MQDNTAKRLRLSRRPGLLPVDNSLRRRVARVALIPEKGVSEASHFEAEDVSEASHFYLPMRQARDGNRL